MTKRIVMASVKGTPPHEKGPRAANPGGVGRGTEAVVVFGARSPKTNLARPRLDLRSNPTLSPPHARGARRANCSMPPGHPAHHGPHRRDPRETLHPCCAGLDVHKKTVVACLRRITPDGRVHQQTRTFRTMTADLLALADWLDAEGATHAAMESTGVYWKPV